jgi:hypothetical protein
MDMEENLITRLQDYLQVLQVASDVPTGVLEQASTGLTLISQSDNKVEGNYVEKGRGIYFLCEDDGNGKGTFLLTSIAGKTIFYVEQISEDLVLVSVEDEGLLYMPSKNKKGEIYEVPPSHRIGVQKAIEGGKTDRLRKYLQEIEDLEGTEKLKKFMKFAEIDMILAAAEVMVENIERSRETIRSLRVFLSFVRTLHPQSDTAKFNLATDQSPVKQFAHSSQLTERCDAFPTTCRVGRCPFRRSGNRCFGMCGLQCNCWRFLCGDCCTHRGCIEHDACCARGGFLATLRCSIPFGFSCSRRFRCP